METEPLEIQIYSDSSGYEPFSDWLQNLKDQAAKARILVRLDRIEKGNLGDFRLFGSLGELRVDFGPGYRVYFGREGRRIIILLGGGDKTSQRKDFKLAQARWEDHLRRK